MRQEVKMLEQKVACLMKSLGACCKIKGNLNCDEIIKAANEHLEKRKSCRIIHQDLQVHLSISSGFCSLYCYSDLYCAADGVLVHPSYGS